MRGVVDFVSDPASCLAVCAEPLSFLFCFGLLPRMFPIIICFHALAAQAAPGTFYASAPIIDVRLVCLLCVTVFLSSVQITLCAGASQTSLASSCWRACGAAPRVRKGANGLSALTRTSVPSAADADARSASVTAVGVSACGVYTCVSSSPAEDETARLRRDAG